ncbi:MAG: hypothetical protein NVV73_13390 [Cellvibrionaceae bacterium]|nr:hypothetical protein [Cellvibrionaceae bacterium]
MKRFASLLVILFGLGMSTLALAAAELVDPAPVVVPSGISEKRIGQTNQKGICRSQLDD